jgi:hypothetical protein
VFLNPSPEVVDAAPIRVRHQEFHAAGDQGQPTLPARGRCLTLEDTVEFFNLVQELSLTPQEKADLVAFLRAL